MLKEQFTQTLLTLEDIESLIHGLVPQKILLVDLNSCKGSLDVANFSANELCDNVQGAVNDNAENYVKSSSFESTECVEMFNTHSTHDMKLFKKSKNRKNAMKEEEKSLELICNGTELQAKSTKDFINRSHQSKPSVHDTKNRSNKIYDYTRGKRKGHKTNSKIFKDLKTANPGEDICINESNKGQDQDVTNLRCSCCFKECASKKSLQMHIRNHEKPKDFSCEKCDKKFLYAYGLCLHSRIHTGERPFKCSSCEKAFISSSALQRHQLVHMRERDTAMLSDRETANVCPSCGKTFSQKGNLTVHMKIHVGKYDHVCKTCQKQFITSGDLKRHDRVHSREKPYTCGNCQKSFTTSSTLVCHMRSHSGERPYLCGVCGATFAILSHLKQHNKIHARGDLWPRRKGATINGENIRRKTAHMAKQTGKDKQTISKMNNESTQMKGLEMCAKDMSVVGGSLQFLGSFDSVSSSIQPNSNSIFINSLFPRTIYSIQSPGGITYVGERMQEIKIIPQSGNDIQVIKVTSSSFNAASSTRECETNTRVTNVVSQSDAPAISVHCLPSSDNTLASRTFINLSDVASPSDNMPFKCSIAENTVSLYNPIESTTSANGNTISLCNKLNSYISPVIPTVQHISLDSSIEHFQTKNILTVATQGIPYATSSFCEDKESNFSIVP